MPLALFARAVGLTFNVLLGPLGVGLASLYYAVADVLGPEYLRYSDNIERFFLLFLALIILSWTIAMGGRTNLRRVAECILDHSHRGPRLYRASSVIGLRSDARRCWPSRA